MNYLILILTLMSFLSWGQNCRFTASASNFIGEIDVTEQAVSHSFTLRRRSNSQNCRNFRAYFGKGNANSYNRKVYTYNNNLDYNLYQESALNTILKDFGDAGAGEYIEGNLANRNTNYDFNFFVKLIDFDSVFSKGPGFYNDLIPISIYSIKNNGTLVFQRTIYMNVQIIIPRYAELSVGSIGTTHDPTNTTYVVDFGTIQDNEVQNARLSIKGNVGFGIYMSSMNGGKLVNGNSNVGYQVKLNTTNYQTLSNPNQQYYITQKNTGTSQNGDNYIVSLRLGTLPQNAENGTYEDTITVTVNAW